MATKRGATEIAIEDDSDVLTILPLGAGNEVGRSCIVIEYKNKKIMLDAGIHPGKAGLNALPFFDEIDPAEIDVLLVTHFHLDHAGSVPYFMEKTPFRGRTFMTHPTKAIYKWLLSDYVRVSNVSAEEQLYNDKDLMQSYERIEVIDYHQVVDVDGIKFSAFNAGHVLGAAMFLIEVAGVKILYTGDYSREEDRHLMAAEKPNATIDVLICESTYGVQSHEPRVEREARFTSVTHKIVRRGGRCLIPVFALGRAQELLLILDEYWEAHPELDDVPIYYASSLAKKCMAIYQTYINMMNEHIRKQFAISNPFVFKHISSIRNSQDFADSGPCVVMASPGMLQNGLSRELFERWCSFDRNGVVLTGYSVEGTLARDLLNEPEAIESLRGKPLPVRLTIDSISFSAHVDFTQNSQFIYETQAPHVVLVHGEYTNMHRLKSALHDYFSENNLPTEVHTPANCEPVELRFKGAKDTKLVGELATQASEYVQHLTAQPLDATKRARLDPATEAPDGEVALAGVLVAKEYKYYLMEDTYVSDFTGLSTAQVLQRQAVPYHGTYSLLKYHLEQMFGLVQDATTLQTNPLERLDAVYDLGVCQYFKPAPLAPPADPASAKAPPAVGSPEPTTDHVVYRVYDAVDVVFKPKAASVELEWVGNYANDMIADTVVAIILNIECSPASVKVTKSACGGGSHHASGQTFTSGLTTAHIPTLVKFLEPQFGDVQLLAHASAPPSPTSDEGQVTSPLDGYTVVPAISDTRPVVALQVQVDRHPAVIRLDDCAVLCNHGRLQTRVEHVLARVVKTLRPHGP
ncbi:endoribonuclease ysh1 [Dimargaris verticillata]|uniref:Endoribonuclease YSH1 n=1 Tax=Dimargaris verticillata TaxID=2761393 RepID=A0A9W8B600_9FUNG|nr:endoribonuclease ysh1 [Dimargaris verticillata]